MVTAHCRCLLSGIRLFSNVRSVSSAASSPSQHSPVGLHIVWNTFAVSVHRIQTSAAIAIRDFTITTGRNRGEQEWSTSHCTTSLDTGLLMRDQTLNCTDISGATVYWTMRPIRPWWGRTAVVRRRRRHTQPHLFHLTRRTPKPAATTHIL